MKTIRIVVAEIKKEVATTQEEVAIEEAKEAGTREATNVKALGAAPKDSKVVEVLEDNEAH